MKAFPIAGDDSPLVVLELIYRLKVADVMTKEPLTLGEGASFRDAQRLLRARSITGLPIAEGGRLLGIVSMGDIVEALDGGWIEEPVGPRMSRNVIVLQDDMPLSFAVSWFDKYGFGRFPVLDKDCALVGIVTPSDVMGAILAEMNREVLRLEEGLEGGGSRGGPRFREFAVAKFDFERAGRASAEIKKELRLAGAPPAAVRRAAIASYELEINLVIHSDGGRLLFASDGRRATITAKDRGPGIADLDRAMREGWSTANDWIRSLGFGAGMGLPNAKRAADEFRIESRPGEGTEVTVVVDLGGGEGER